MKKYRFLLFLLFIFLINDKINAQTDTTFWFAVPEVTWAHNSGNGEPTYIRISALDITANVKLSMPATGAFTPITINIPAGTTQTIDLTGFIRTGYPPAPGTENDANLIESGLPGREGIIDTRGFLLESDNLITAYLERSNTNNCDIWALKGKNAMGTAFVIPSQNYFNNQPHTPSAINSFDIVATEDNTSVTLYPKQNLVGPGSWNAGGTYTINLMKGQSVSCVATNTVAASHLGGSRVTSTKPITIIWKDDSVRADQGSGCYDLMGDQMIPTRLAGKEYIVMRGQLGQNAAGGNEYPNSEFSFVMATVANTTVTYTSDNGVSSVVLVAVGDMNRQLMNGDQIGSATPTIDFLHVKADKPIIVFHVTGFGCEMGTAILPTIDGCTGSLEVSFVRSTGEGFYLNIMTKTTRLNGFKIDINGTPYTIPASFFAAVGATGWSYLKKTHNDFGVAHTIGTHGADIPAVITGAVTRVYNSVGVFHLGLINGGTSSGCRYGYFSDFAENRGSAIATSTDSDLATACFGDSVQLKVTGGLTYDWNPKIYITNFNKSNPLVYPPTGVQQYEVTMTRSCFADTTMKVVIVVDPEVRSYYELGYSNTTNCSPLTVNFDNQSIGGVAYVWDFGDGSPQSNLQDPPPKTYTNTSGVVETYTISLTVQGNNCNDYFERTIQVYPSVTVDIVPPDAHIFGCGPLSKTFGSALTGNIDILYWAFGDGDISYSNPNPTHIYYNLTNNDVTYQTILVATDTTYGYCVDRDTVLITVYDRVEADFTATKQVGCSPLSVDIVNSSKGNPLTYAWTFGANSVLTGNPAIDTSFNVTYTNTTSVSMVRNIQLVVTNNNNCTDTARFDNITIYPEFNTTINAVSLPAPPNNCNPVTATLSNTTFPAVVTNFYWNLGDGSTSNSAVSFNHIYSHTQPTIQNYTVGLIGESAFGCRDTAPNIVVSVLPYIDASFTVNDTVDCSPMTISITDNTSPNSGTATSLWTDNGTAFTPSGSTFNRTFTNQTGAIQDNIIELINSNGTASCDALFSKVIRVYPEYTVDFTRSDTLICHNSTITFTDASVYTGVGTALTPSADVSYLWEFGDGTSSNLESPTHQFKNTLNSGVTNQEFNVTLTITYKNECSKAITKKVYVYPRVIPSISTDTVHICTPDTITFTQNSSNADLFKWYYDNAQETVGVSAIFAVENSTPGTIENHTIKLVAGNDFCKDSVTKTIQAYPHLNPQFDVDTTLSCNPGTIEFNNISTGGNLSYNWTFGDGDIGTNALGTFTHKYTNTTYNSIPYNVVLTATNGAGCIENTDTLITILPFIDASFTTDKITGCSPMIISVQNTTPANAYVDSVLWGFDSGTGTSITNPFDVSYTNQTGGVETHTLQLTNTNGTAACDVSYSKTITVYPEIEALFDTDVDTVCQGGTISFNNQSFYRGIGNLLPSNAATFTWNFGDNVTSALHAPTHSFTSTITGTSPQKFTVTLTIAANGCSDDFTKDIWVYPLVKAQMTTPNVLLCSPYTITITNNSLGANQFNWVFSDGTATQTTTNIDEYPIINPLQNDIATKTVYLTAQNDFGCSHTDSLKLTVYPEIKAKINPSDTSGCGPLTVNLANQSTGGNASNNKLTYYWDFGDGLNSTSADNTISHTFANRTSSNVTRQIVLTATNNLGCTNQHDTTVTIFPEVESRFTYLKNTECSPMPVFMDNNSLNGTLFKWNFGFDNQNLDTVAQDFFKTFYHTNTNPNDTSKYKIRLIAFDANHPQCSDTSFKDIIIYPQVRSSFVVSNNDTVCYPEITEFTNNSTGYQLTYVWDYKDGNTSATKDTIHTHLFENRLAVSKVYMVKLSASDKNGCPSADTKRVVARPRIIAGFTFQKDATDKCTPIPVHFSYPTSAINGNRFTWNFGDGVTEVKSKLPFDHIFDNPNLISPVNYTIKLTVDDINTGCMDDTTRVIRIFPRLYPKIDPTNVAGCNPHQVIFTNKTNVAGGVSSLWAFGDNQTSTVKSPNHLFVNLETQNRDYEVLLTSTQDSTGCILTADTTITVYSYVKAIFGLQATSQTENKSGGANSKSVVVGGCTPFDATITDSSKLIETGTKLWNFGYTFPTITDSTALLHQLRYLNFDEIAPLDNANYTIKLVVTNNEGCQDSTEQNLVVYPRPIADFTGIFHGCHPLTIDMTNQSEANNGYSYYWELGDGSTLVEKDITHTFYNYSFFDPKIIPIKLTATSESECSDSVIKQVTVYPKPLASITTPEDRGCPPFQTLLTNTSKGSGLTYYWDFDNGDRDTTQNTQSKTPLYLNKTGQVITYNVTLIAETNTPDQCYDTVLQPIIVYPEVAASFTPDIHEGCSPLIVNFSNNSTPLSADGATVFNWQFGDGVTSNATKPTYRYVNEFQNDLTYTVTLYAASVHGCDSSITDSITVYLSPNADFVILNPIKTYPETTYEFRHYVKPGPWTFNWDYGDGSSISLVEDSIHTYTYTGWGNKLVNFVDTVWLVTYSDHCADTSYNLVTRYAPPPEITIPQLNTKGCIPWPVNFTTTYEFGMEETITWDFGDGSDPVTEWEPTHVYDTAGIFIAYVEIEGDGGIDIDTTRITVNPLPIPGFEIAPDFVMLPDQKVQFYNTSYGGVSYFWDFGDGGSSTERSPSYLYSSENLDGYPVKLVVTTIHGCVDSLTHPTRVTVSGEGSIEFPNAFLPTDSKSDGYYSTTSNDVFYPVHFGVRTYELWIFNRWGEQIYYSDDVMVGWNGRYGNNGKTLEQDVYFWKSKGEFNNGVPFKLAGDVTLIRR